MSGESSDIVTNDLETGESCSSPQALEYKLPDNVKATMESFVQRASNMGLINMCFVGFNIALAAIINSSESSISSTASSVLHALVYVSSIANLAVAALSVVFVHKVNHLPCDARDLSSNPKSWPSRASRGESMRKELWLLPSALRDFELMIRFGLAENMRLVWKALLCGCFLGGGTLLTAVGVFMCLSESWIVSASVAIFILPLAAWLLFHCLFRR